MYLTVVDPGAPAAGGCVDLEIPAAKLARPRITFRGDALYLLDRRLVNGAMQSWVLRFPLQELTCR